MSTTRIAALRARNAAPAEGGPLTLAPMALDRPWKGRRPRVLLTTVFKPFNVVDAYNAPGNIYEMGVFHRSFTRRQGFFTMLQEQRTYPLHLLAHNIDADTTVLEFPSFEEFQAELDKGYDIVGVSAVVATAKKAERMCAEARARGAWTVLGGAASLGVGKLYPAFADFVCKGDGVSYLRALLGETDPTRKMGFPVIRLHNRVHGLLGLPLQDHNFPVALGLGCPRRCDFCSTSAQFGGRYTPFFESGAELFRFMESAERVVTGEGRKLDYLSFMVYDENFLLNFPFVEEFRRLSRQTALRDTQYLMFGFADAEVLTTYPPEDLLEIGIDTLWVGVESPSASRFEKVSEVDVRRAIDGLAGSGIKVIGSLIAGLEEHTEESIRRDMDFALTLATVGVQYMPLNPIPGTAYWERLEQKGMLRVRGSEWLNMSHFSVEHPTLTEERVLALLDEFFDREHALGGPLVYRFLRSRWLGWQKHRNSANPWVRGRTRVFAADLRRGYPVLLIGERLAPSPEARRLFRQLRREVQGAFGWTETVTDALTGRLPGGEAATYLTLSAPLMRTVWREVLLTHALRKDPRNRGLRDALLGRSAAIARSGRGTVPWGQPETMRTAYP